MIHQIEAVYAKRDATLSAEETLLPAPTMLIQLEGIGPETAAVLVPLFRNRRQLAARKLPVALWKYLKAGVVIEEAVVAA